MERIDTEERGLKNSYTFGTGRGQEIARGRRKKTRRRDIMKSERGAARGGPPTL